MTERELKKYAVIGLIHSIERERNRKNINEEIKQNIVETMEKECNKLINELLGIKEDD